MHKSITVAGVFAFVVVLGWLGVARGQEHAPLERMGTPADVADAVLFLLSPASRWISGVNLVVDGGMSTVSRW